jgi:hypothetical protein
MPLPSKSHFIFSLLQGDVLVLRKFLIVQVKEHSMAIIRSDPLLRSLFLIFIFTWGLGLALRILANPSRWNGVWNATDPELALFYEQIRVVWFLRWLFGYLPVTGPVSMTGAIFQLAAFLTVGITAVLAWIWPDVFYTLYWLPIVVLAVMIFLAHIFMAWLWKKQNSKK